MFDLRSLDLQTLADRAGAAAARLPGLRALVAEAVAAEPSLLPGGADEWRSGAAERYRERLAELRAEVRRSCGELEAALFAAERELDVADAALEDERAAVRAAELAGDAAADARFAGDSPVGRHGRLG
ncbi:hypothetical protein [Agromyces seonyuensis]|uniref:Flagellar FliJ protein n=1 Tax=Agromyces seonyuensis TaxID=2662446 RepID=A0A6I4NZT2_9MICO|nr:hypothetical protein [Agromyces seonyuensis]MWB99661.1 hypothetical protein [Agromyces seonyuensis]